MPEAAGLLQDARVRHFWDPHSLVGTAYAPMLGLSDPAWDVWLLFGREASWQDEAPAPDWWEHQLGVLPEARHLDPARFARRARALLERQPSAGEPR